MENMENRVKENPSYYSILTADVRYCKELSPQEKLLFSEITALTNFKGYCWATNNYFAELYGLSKDRISRQISNLAKHGFIDVQMIYVEGTKQIKERRIYLSDTHKNKSLYNADTPIGNFTDTPIGENDNTPPVKKADTPIGENDKGNNQNQKKSKSNGINNINQSAQTPKNGDNPTPNDTIDINIINHAIENNIPLDSLKDRYSKFANKDIEDYLNLLIEAYKRNPYYNLLKINIDALDIHSIKKIVTGNIMLDDLLNEFPTYQREIKELVSLIVETLHSKKKSFRITKEDIDARIVKEAFCVLDNNLLRYIVESLMKNKTEVKNTKAYLLTTIYNAHTTYNNHYSLDFQANLENNGFFIKKD